MYVRVSSDEQRDAQTINTQREVLRKHVTLLDATIVEEYADEGVSGTIPLCCRPAGDRLISDARSGRFEEVLVYRLDRLGRDPRAVFNAVGDLENLGIAVRSATEPFDTTTPSGRLMLGMLASFAGFERESILQRSRDGTDRLAREGAWLGGIVPYGYRVEGVKRDARLVVADAPLAGAGLSEAEVVRLIFRLAADDQLSTIKIADKLNALGIAPAYARDRREVRRGKRIERTAGIWRAGRVRNMLVSTTYKGEHEYGKRSTKHRNTILRQVPAIVTVEEWARAQETLRRNRSFSSPIARHKYLLRGLIKCADCGLTFIGTGYTTAGGRRAYYVCNGKQSSRGINGASGGRCPSKSLPGSIEDAIWDDIEAFLRNPGDILERAKDQLANSTPDADTRASELAAIQSALDDHEHQRDRVVGLYRRGGLDDAALDRQLAEIDCEKHRLESDASRIRAKHRDQIDAERSVLDATELLSELHARLDEPITWELKRELVEALVAAISAETVETDGKPIVRATVTYRFTPVITCTGTGSWLQ
jgi:site-specific DNA recombinase